MSGVCIPTYAPELSLILGEWVEAKAFFIFADLVRSLSGSLVPHVVTGRGSVRCMSRRIVLSLAASISRGCRVHLDFDVTECWRR